jgi:5-methylcytosine-specific restriction protein B
MESAAWAVLGRGLRGDRSAIAPDLQTWDPAVANDLKHRIEDTPDEGRGSFMAKLEGQLAGASDEVKVLAAELMYIHSAPLTNVSPQRKRARLTAVLSWTAGDYTLPVELDAALEVRGSFNGGVGFNVQMWNQLTWLCRFVIGWTAQSEDRRALALRDPFEFSAVAGEVPQEVSSIRFSLEYLAWPGVFPAVASADHRRWILKAMAKDFGGPTGSDALARTRDLVSLRQWHERKSKSSSPVDWYQPPYIERWFPNAQRAPRAWLIRPGDGGSALVEAWLAEGFVSLSAKMLGTVEPGSPEPAVRKAVGEGYTHLDASQREATAAAYHAFLTLMKDEDVVATIDGGKLYAGLVSGPARYSDQIGSRLRRDVLWSQAPVDQSDLAAPLPSLLDQQGTVVDATAAYDILASLLDDTSVVDDEDDEAASSPIDKPVAATTPTLPPITDAVAGALHMDREVLQEVVDLLQRRQQIVLYGPPGTGKTYVAKELAKHLVGDPSRVRLVQFHPSYSYEDFFEGYRPAIEDGQPTFALKDGPLRLLAAEAKNPENRDNTYILIIDEMNRANLAKVFGELYFLLEYRKETVRLQYQPDEAFFLPPNLFIIGTMNTSDRSIALVDAAIRRRFPFFEMHPSEEPVRSVLERYLEANHITDDRAALLAELNRRMGDSGRDLQIGPSYLMRPEITSDADIDRVWRYDIMPLLEEHYYGQKDREGIRAEFGVAVLRSALPSSSREAEDVTLGEGSAALANAEVSAAEADPAGPAQA